MENSCLGLLLGNNYIRDNRTDLWKAFIYGLDQNGFVWEPLSTEHGCAIVITDNYHVGKSHQARVLFGMATYSLPMQKCNDAIFATTYVGNLNMINNYNDILTPIICFNLCVPTSLEQTKQYLKRFEIQSWMKSYIQHI